MAIISLPSPTTVKATQMADNQVVKGLLQTVANLEVLSLLTRELHWNLQGSSFFSIHPALGSQYESLADMQDAAAERIRALGAFVHPVDAAEWKVIANMPNMLGRPPYEPHLAVSVLIDCHLKGLSDLKELVKVSGQQGDLTTQNMALNWVEATEKTIWMLRSFNG
jgi:starvation-inducible DNA-binding protein